MRTTLSIDDDVLFAAKSIALREGRSLGEVVSDLARRSLQAPVPGEAATSSLDAQLAALGLTPYRAPEVAVVTQAQIEALRDAEGV
jgi:hypothetical protein